MQKPFNGSEWYNKTIESRTLEALRREDAEAAARYEAMSREELLEVIRRKAEELGCVPSMPEVAGAAYIAEAYGNWRGALREAGFGWPEGSALTQHSLRYKEEYARQQEQYRAQRAEKLQRRREKRQEREERKAAEAAAAAAEKEPPEK